MMYKFPVVAILLTLISCSQSKPVHNESIAHEEIDPYDLYVLSDSVIYKNDTVIVINKKYDTAMIETGIFTYLYASFPAFTSGKLVPLMRKAVAMEKRGQDDSARTVFRQVAYYYLNMRLKEQEGISDMEEYITWNVNEAILYSYAYWKIGNLDKSIEVLAPFLATDGVEPCKIREMFIEQCIRKFGKAIVVQELNTCSKTIHHSTPYYMTHVWACTILGTDVAIADYYPNEEPPTVQYADSIIKSSAFYQSAL